MAFQGKKPEALGVKAPFPGFIEPALAASIDRVPSGERWIHEIKFDGYRVQVHLANEAVRVFTRRGHDWTNRIRKVANDAWHVKANAAIIDGEVVVPAADGSTDFSVLQNELKGTSTKFVLVAFDLLYLNGSDIRKVPLIERKAALKKIITGSDVQFSESFEIDGREMFTHACKVGLEGVVSKVRDSVYASGRGNNWVKKTCAQRETLTIAGYALDEGKWDGMYLARRRGRRPDLCWQGRPRLRQGLGRRTPKAPEAVDPTDAALRQAHRAQGHLGRTEAARRDRVPRQVGRRKSAAPVLQRAARGSLTSLARPPNGTNRRLQSL
jgi:bifunctional non-homologous end joining protein LigD